MAHMSRFICTTCGTQFAEAAQPPASCPICEDPRQYVPGPASAGRRSRSSRGDHANRVADERELTGVGTEPSFAIGQRALLVRVRRATDDVGLRDAARRRERRRVSSVAAAWRRSPSRTPTTTRGWSSGPTASAAPSTCTPTTALGHAPGPRVELWDGETQDLGAGLTLLRCGGHFAGGDGPAPGGRRRRPRRAAQRRHRAGRPRPPLRRLHVQLPESHPAPGRGRAHRRGARAAGLRGLYGAWWGRLVPDAKAAVERSADRYLAALTGTFPRAEE